MRQCLWWEFRTALPVREPMFLLCGRARNCTMRSVAIELRLRKATLREFSPGRKGHVVPLGVGSWSNAHNCCELPSNASYALDGSPLPPLFSLLCSLSSVGRGGPRLFVFGGSRLERCQSTSRHGTCRFYAQSARRCTDSSLQR